MIPERQCESRAGVTTVTRTEPHTLVGGLVGLIVERFGLDRVFTVPGEAVLPFIHLLGQQGVDLVTMRHESSAGFAAIADFRFTGRPSVVAVNRSPGLANLGIALDATRRDPTPLLAVVGGTPRGQDQSTGYQSGDPAHFGSEWADVVDLRDQDGVPRLFELIESRLTARIPRPLVLYVPADAWDMELVPPSGTAPSSTKHGGGSSVEPSVAVAHAAGSLSSASRPVVVAGSALRGIDYRHRPGIKLDALGARFAVPILMANKQLDLLPRSSAYYCGDLHQGTHPETHAMMARADLIVFLGTLPTEVHLKGWYCGQEVLVVHPRPIGVGDHLATDPLMVLEGLLAAETDIADGDWLAAFRSAELRLSEARPKDYSDGVDFTLVVNEIAPMLDDDAIVVLDAGNFGSWVHRFLRLGPNMRLLALDDGSMGFGVPAGIALKRRVPSRQVVVFVGDGGVMMTGNELAVARSLDEVPLVVIADNSGYGAIRAQGHRRYGTDDVACDLHNPSFRLWAEAFSIPAMEISSREHVGPTLLQMFGRNGGGVLSIKTSARAAHANFDIGEQETT